MPRRAKSVKVRRVAVSEPQTRIFGYVFENKGRVVGKMTRESYGSGLRATVSEVFSTFKIGRR